MIFNSYIFIFIFLPITWLIFNYSRTKFGIGTSFKVLSTASLIYYSWWNPSFVFLPLASVFLNFLMGKKISRADNPKLWVIAGIMLNLLLLGYFKYAMFFIDNLNLFSGTEFDVPRIILPIGISFFTFQQITYLIDLGKGDDPKYSFFDYLLFVTFFPQLIAGPIVHHKEMMPQFKANSVGDLHTNLSLGITLFVIGLSKKVLIADTLAPYASITFGHAADGVAINIISAWIAAFAFSFQLYFDFSGYSDMALGIGAMFGIFLPVNFLSPYKATSLVEFWRRWHISLSRFLKEYLYIPLGGNRVGQVRMLSNLLLTMIIGGLWHGANWTFILWGFLHGAGLSLSHLFSKYFKIGSSKRFVVRASFVSLTFLFVVLSWVLFRAENFSAAVNMYKTMFAFKDLILPIELKEVFPDALFAGDFHKTHVFHIILAGLIAFLAPNSTQIINNDRFKLPLPQSSTRLRWGTTKLWVTVTAILFVACLFNMSSLSEFLYYQF